MQASLVLNHSWHLNTALIDLRKKLDTKVSYSKLGGGVIDTNCQRASESLYETSAVSLFARLPTPVLLAARGFNAHLSSLTLKVGGLENISLPY